MFERYLPYAIAFGLEHDYIRKWTEVPTTPVPPWYIPYPQPYYGGFGRTVVGGGSGGGKGMAAPAPRMPEGGAGMPNLGDASRGMTGGLASMSTGLTGMLSNAASTLPADRNQAAAAAGRPAVEAPAAAVGPAVAGRAAAASAAAAVAAAAVASIKRRNKGRS